MSFAVFWSLLRRESRGQRGKLVFMTLCLAVGVCAIVSVQALVAAMREGTALKSRELLGADITVSSRLPLPAELDEVVGSLPGSTKTLAMELPTMAAAPGGTSRIVQIIAVDGPWPLYGRFTTEPADAAAKSFAGQGVTVERGLLRDLGLAVGDQLLLGGKPFPIMGLVREAPEKSGFAFMLGPRVFMARATLDQTGLLGFGSRLEYRALIALGEADRDHARAVAGKWRERLPGGEFLDIKSHDRAEERLSGPLDKVESYLGLVALLSLVLGGIGVARIVQAWIESRQRGIAVMRCLGMRPMEVAWVYLGQILALALIGSLVGGSVGLFAPRLVAALVGDLLSAGLISVWQPAALLDGLVLGPAMALLFSIPALAALWRVSPARVFRSAAEPLPQPRAATFISWSIVAGGLFLAAWRTSSEALPAAVFVLVLAAAIMLLALAAYVLRAFLRLLPRERFELHIRQGLAALLRPAAGVQGALVALGLGALVVSSILMVEDRLAQGIIQALPGNAPTAFFIDVQPDQWATLRERLQKDGATAIDSVPVVMARLSEVDGVSVKELVARRKEKDEGRSWVLTREQRITWLESFNDSNEIIEGEDFGAGPENEISLEERFARDLGAKIGSRLRFDLQGIPIDFVVTSLRRVEWASFRINFFLVAEPGVLDEAPYFRIASARLDADAEDRFQDSLASVLPNVTMIRVRSILDRVVGILEGLLQGIAALGSFTVLAGLGILAGSVSSASLRRSRETALLKVLGLRPRGVLLLLLIEFGVLGFVAGGLGALGGWALAGLFGAHFELEGATRPIIAVWVVLVVTGLTMVAGSLAAGRALRARPRLVLAGD